MNRRLAAVALAVALVGGSVVVLVADPLASQPAPAPVDATAESPGELALGALEATERRSFDVRLVQKHSSEDEADVSRARIDRGRQRVSVSYRPGDPSRSDARYFYGECLTATRFGTEVRFRVSPFGGYPSVFHLGDVEPSDLEARVVDRTGDTVVVRVTNTSAAVSLVFGRENPREYVREEGLRGNLTVEWNADEGAVQRVEYVGSSRVNETHRETYRQQWEFREWGGVDVDRPGWAGYTHQEFLCDVTRFRR